MGSDYAGRLKPQVAWLGFGFRSCDPDRRLMSTPRAYALAQDADLVSWSADGDRRAFDQIVARHGPLALRVALRLIPNVPAAEDVVQEAMLRAWAQVRHFDPQRARFTTWLYRIVVNLCIDQRRRVQPAQWPDDFEPPDGAAGADDLLVAHERRAALAIALSNLPARQRAALVLVYEEGLSGAEVARILGLSAKAVERLLARARATLRERLQAGHD